MKKLIVIVLILLNVNLAFAETAETARLCDAALNSCSSEVTSLKDLLKLSDQRTALILQQRDAAMKDLEKANQPSLLPWYGWLLIGAAASIIAVGIRR